MSTNASAFSSHFSTVAPNYDVVLSDVWGVVHNGVAATANACDALRQFRSRGGTVVLITNAPRPGEFVQRFIDNLQVPRDSYDAIVSSGDVTRSLIRERAGERVGHIADAELDAQSLEVTAYLLKETRGVWRRRGRVHPHDVVTFSPELMIVRNPQP